MVDARFELGRLAQAQRRMLPQTAPWTPGYDLALAHRPASLLTGDYHDFFPLPDGSRGVFVGDGAGHGAPANVLVVTMRAILVTHPQLHDDPGRAMTAASRMLRALTPPDLFMTGVYLLLGDRGQVRWASAGHDPPLRVSRHGEVAPVDLAPVGMPLGLDEEEGYETVPWDLAPGERLLLFTDGLVEARSATGEPFGR